MNGTRAQESTISDPDSLCESRFECPICLAWLQDPILTSCGHRFCRTCIQSWLKKDKACPVDNIKLEPTIDLFPDNFTRREILQQVIFCPFSNLGCTAKISPVDLDNHIAICMYKSTQNVQETCLFHDVGCLIKFKSKEELEKHNTTNMNQHLALLFNVCSELKNKSPHGHSSVDKSQEIVFWDPQKGNSEETGESVQNLLKVLYEKLVILEQKSREQDILIKNMSQQISTQNSNFREMTTRYCNGTFLWIISDFKTKLNSMYVDPKKMFYSPEFYTSVYGYRLCVRLNLSPNDPNFIALIVHVMKTDHDYSLDWPFSGRMNITLVHPNYPAQNIKETMYTRPELEAFRRPTELLNPRGFGYTEFASVQDILKQGFLKGDELTIKVQVFATTYCDIYQ